MQAFKDLHLFFFRVRLSSVEPASQRRRHRDPLGDPRAQARDAELGAGAVSEPHDLARVAGDRAALEVEDRAILATEC